MRFASPPRRERRAHERGCKTKSSAKRSRLAKHPTPDRDARSASRCRGPRVIMMTAQPPRTQYSRDGAGAIGIAHRRHLYRGVTGPSAPSNEQARSRSPGGRDLKVELSSGFAGAYLMWSPRLPRRKTLLLDRNPRSGISHPRTHRSSG